MCAEDGGEERGEGGGMSRDQMVGKKKGGGSDRTPPPNCSWILHHSMDGVDLVGPFFNILAATETATERGISLALTGTRL